MFTIGITLFWRWAINQPDRSPVFEGIPAGSPEANWPPIGVMALAVACDMSLVWLTNEWLHGRPGL